MDREIDRLIVKHVFKIPMAQESEAYIDGWLDNQNFYSERFEDAIKIAEKFDFWQVTKLGMQGKYLAILGANKNVAFAETAPLAICLASLKAVGIEV